MSMQMSLRYAPEVQTVPMLGKKMLLERLPLVERTAAEIAEVKIVIGHRKLVLVAVLVASWSRSQMPLHELLFLKVSAARDALKAISSHCPVDLQGLVAPRRSRSSHVVPNEIVVLITLEQSCRLSLNIKLRTFVIVHSYL
jgi:hypothetical protein